MSCKIKEDDKGYKCSECGRESTNGSWLWESCEKRKPKPKEGHDPFPERAWHVQKKF